MIPAAPPVVAKLGSSLTLNQEHMWPQDNGPYMPTSQPLDAANAPPHVAEGTLPMGVCEGGGDVGIALRDPGGPRVTTGPFEGTEEVAGGRPEKR